MKKAIATLLFLVVLAMATTVYAGSGWFVVTYSGDAVAGPFTLLNDCTDMAKIMHAKYYNVSEVCQYK